QAVVSVILGGYESAQVPCHVLTGGRDLAEQLGCLAVVLATTRPLPKHGAACRVGCGDSGEDRECGGDAWCGHLVGLSTDQLGDVKERPSLTHAITSPATVPRLD